MTSIDEKVKRPKMRISTVVNKMLKPILLQYSGKVWSEKFVRDLQRFIYTRTGRYVGFREVNVNALSYATRDMDANTFSFNIIPTSTLVDEYNLSSTARRRRFEDIYNPSPILSDKEGLKHRFQISIPNIRSHKQFDVQLIISDDGKVWPVGVIGYYGTNMNGWAGRVGLKQTSNPHKHPSTHYMTNTAAQDYVFIIKENAGRFGV